MNILFISDIHSNFYALKAISDLFESADLVVCLGDIVGYYCQVNEVIDFLRNKKIKCILGNHDYYLLYGYPNTANNFVKFGIDFARERISFENKEWLKCLPMSEGMIIEKKKLIIFHGSPWDPINEYLYQNKENFYKLQDFNYDVFAFGHTHREYSEKNKGKMFINPGSVGQNRNEYGIVSACIYDLNKEKIDFVKKQYDWRKVLKLTKSFCGNDFCLKHFPIL